MDCHLNKSFRMHVHAYDFTIMTLVVIEAQWGFPKTTPSVTLRAGRLR